MPWSPALPVRMKSKDLAHLDEIRYGQLFCVHSRGFGFLSKMKIATSGGGLAGLSTYLWLHKVGRTAEHDVEGIYEQRKGSGKHSATDRASSGLMSIGRSFSLAPDGLRVLQRLGAALHEEVMRTAVLNTAFPVIETLWLDNDWVQELDEGADWPRRYMAVHEESGPRSSHLDVAAPQPAGYRCWKPIDSNIYRRGQYQCKYRRWG